MREKKYSSFSLPALCLPQPPLGWWMKFSLPPNSPLLLSTRVRAMFCPRRECVQNISLNIFLLPHFTFSHTQSHGDVYTWKFVFIFLCFFCCSRARGYYLHLVTGLLLLFCLLAAAFGIFQKYRYNLFDINNMSMATHLQCANLIIFLWSTFIQLSHTSLYKVFR